MEHADALQTTEITYAKPMTETIDQARAHSNEHIHSQDDTEGSLTHTHNEKGLQEATELVQKCKEVYENHKLEEAYRFLKQFEEIKGSLSTEDLEAYNKIAAEDQLLFEEIHNEYDYLMRVDHELYSDEGWKVDPINATQRIYYKTGADDLLIAKIEAEVDVPLLHLLSMINEVELWKLWNAFMNCTAEVKTLHRAAKVYYVEYGLPYPLTNREIHLYGVGVNRLYENGTVVILAKSVDNDQAFFDKHEIKKVVHSGTINIDVNLGAFEIKPLSRDKCILRGVANLNPKFNWVPKNILNWVIRKGTKQMIEKIIAGARKFKGSPWEKEIHSERKKDFYEWLDRQLEEFYVTQDAKKAEKKAEEKVEEKIEEKTEEKESQI